MHFMLTNLIAFATGVLSLAPVQVALEEVPAALQGQTWGKMLPNRTVNDVPLTINGRPYEHGVGTHAHSAWIIPIGRNATRFRADVGMPLSRDPGATVRFKVYGDKDLLFESPIMTPTKPAVHVDVDLVGRQELRLIVTDAGDGTSYDRANWADAWIEFKQKPTFPTEFSAPEFIPAFTWGTASIPTNGNGDPFYRHVDAAIYQAMRSYGIPGCSVTLVDGSRIVYSKGYGYAELTSRPFLPTTATRCGSVAKSIAGIGALMLIDRGVLSLDELVMPILRSAKIVPAKLKGKTPDPKLEQMRVRDLLDHTTGFGAGGTYTASYQGVNVATDIKKSGVATASDVVSHCLANVRFDSEPGRKFNYANANFVILGRVIEAKTGLTYASYLSDVVRPALKIPADQMFVSPNQWSPLDPGRPRNEACYYMKRVSPEYSFDPEERILGKRFGEAYRGMASESSDAAGGTATSSWALGQMLVAMRQGLLGRRAVEALLTPPVYASGSQSFYSKGFNVTLTHDNYFLSHGGMTLHCGGALGNVKGIQFAVVCNWNNNEGPYADAILAKAVGDVLNSIK